MTRPGDRLRSVAVRVCSASTMERLIDPVIADMRCEHAIAERQGRAWQRRWVRVSGSWAFWRVMGAVAANGTIGRTLLWTAAVTLVIIFLDSLTYIVGAAGHFRPRRADGARAFLYLVPAAFPLAVSVGLLVGILCGMRGRAVTQRVRRATLVMAVCFALGSFVTYGWIIPASNQAFRVAVSGIRSDKLSKGLNELTFRELQLKMDGLNRGGMRGSVQALQATFTFHTRFALSIEPIVFGLFALGLLGVGRDQRSSVFIGIAAVATCVTYYALLSAATMAVFSGWSPALVWLPNAILLTGTIFLAKHSQQSKPEGLHYT